MSKNSRRNRRQQLQRQEIDLMEDEFQQNLELEPIVIESEKGKGVPVMREPIWPILNEQEQSEEAEKETTGRVAKKVEKTVEDSKKAAEDHEGVACEQKMPSWVEDYLKYQAVFTEQIAGQIVEDHRVLIDHGFRLSDLEDRLGLISDSVKSVGKIEPVKELEKATEVPMEQVPDPADLTVLASSMTQPLPVTESKTESKKPEVDPQPKSEPKPQPKPEPKPEPEPESKPEPEPKPQPNPEPKSEPELCSKMDLVPREMYEAKSFENGKWRLRGPYKRISQAEQAAKGDLSKIKIVQVWWNPERDIICGYMSAEDMERYL